MSRITNEPIELVIFDCDGVLVDSEPVIGEVVSEIATSFGWQLSPDDAAKVVRGWSNDDILAGIEEQVGKKLDIDFQEMFAERAYKLFERDLLPMPGVLTVLNELPTPYCMATNSVHEEAEFKLRVSGLLPWFTNRSFCVEDVEHGKPAPDLFLKAAASIRVDPKRALVVEDSVTGVQAGVAAGMRVLGLAHSDENAADLAAAGATVIHEIREVLNFVERH